jgi:hypothetical protein
MSPQAKVHLGTQAEAMLASWPAPSSDDAAWENRAAKIVAAATNAPRVDNAEIAALFAKPALDSEPGESESLNVSAVVTRSASGVKAMSQDSNQGSSGKPPSSSIAPTSGAVSKRPSLKELAARANQASASGSSSSMRPSTSVPPPSAEAVAQDKQSRPSSPSPSVVPPKASVPPPRPLEAGKDDSGRVDLNAINQSATPAQVAAAEQAKPATHALLDDAAGEDKPVAANDAGEGAKVKNIADARAKKTKKKGEAAKTNDVAKVVEAAPVVEAAKKVDAESSGGGAKWAAILAILGLAAGGFVLLRNKQPPQQPVAAVVQEKPVAAPVAVDQQKIAEEPKPVATGLSIDSLPSAAPAESAKAPTGTKVAAAGTDEDLRPPPPAPEPVAPTALPTATAPTGKPGDLSSAMANAVGGSADKPVNADDATPAAARTGSQNIPEQPPQGSVSAATRSVIGGAKACVAGADDVSHANITFSSSGTVSSVSVSGWAAKNGKTACVQAALKGANVGPFSKPSYTVGVPIRP